MKKITSKENEKIKIIKKLRQKKYREKFGKFCVENFKIILDGAYSNYLPEEIFVTEKFLTKNSDKLNKLDVKNIFLIPEKITNSFSSLETPPGICAVYKKKIKKINFKKKIVYLNKINDPGNLGAILRSALAFDFNEVILDEKCVDLYNPKVISSAKDAIFKLNIEFDEKLDILNKVKKKMKIFTTNLEKGKDLKMLNKEKLFCLVLGSESHGVDEKINNLSNNFIKIKMSDEIESLNVAVSAGIIFNSYYNK